MQFNSPLSATINYKNQKQNDDSSNFSKPYEDFSKTLSGQTNDISDNIRDSKVVKIQKITKRPIANNPNNLNYQKNINQ